MEANPPPLNFPEDESQSPILDSKVNFIDSSFASAHFHQLCWSHSQFIPFSLVYKFVSSRLKEEKAITSLKKWAEPFLDTEMPDFP